jgi:hypothetical protein
VKTSRIWIVTGSVKVPRSTNHSAGCCVLKNAVTGTRILSRLMTEYSATTPIVIVPRPKSRSSTARNVALDWLLSTGGNLSTSAFMMSIRRGPGTSMSTMPLRCSTKPPSVVPSSRPAANA